MDPSRRIRLNVGGRIFETTVKTLTCFPDSYFAIMLSGRWAVEDTIWLDRDGDVFSHVLSFLRAAVEGEPYSLAYLPAHALQQLAREAHFFQLNELEGRALGALQDKETGYGPGRGGSDAPSRDAGAAGFSGGAGGGATPLDDVTYSPELLALPFTERLLRLRVIARRNNDQSLAPFGRLAGQWTLLHQPAGAALIIKTCLRHGRFSLLPDGEHRVRVEMLTQINGGNFNLSMREPASPDSPAGGIYTRALALDTYRSPVAGLGVENFAWTESGVSFELSDVAVNELLFLYTHPCSTVC
jgi:hypothetical protein